jgi:diguanylate cyclase (GGDEF)-like protein/PAS domain S-box-containing protein
MSFEIRENDKKKVTSTVISHENRRSDTQLRSAVSAMQSFLFDPNARQYMIESACNYISGLTESEKTVCYVADDQAKCLLSDAVNFEILGQISSDKAIPKRALSDLLVSSTFFEQTQVFNRNIPTSIFPLLPLQTHVKSALFIPVYVNHELRALLVSVKKKAEFSSLQLERIKPVVGSLICSLRSAEAVAGSATTFEEKLSGNQFLKSLMSTSPAAILVVDDQLSIIVSNQNAERLFSGEQARQPYASIKRGLIGMPVENYLPHYRDLFFWSQQEDKYGTGEDNRLHTVFRDQQAFKTDGQESIVDITPFRYSNGLKTFTVLQILETRHQRHVKSLVQNEQNHLLAIRHLIPIAVLKVDLRWRCIFANDRWLLDSGLTEEETIGYGWSAALFDNDRKTLFSELKKCLNSGRDHKQDIKLMSPLGDVKWCELNAQLAVNERQQVDSFLITLTDITARINYQEKLRKVAEYDPLTGLVNRSLLFDRLQQTFYVAEREKILVCVMFLDLDGFKLINDKLGHDIGDELLKQVASRLKQTLRKNDTIARFGGDEFVILLGHDDHPTTISRVAEKLISVIANPFNLKDNEVKITTSVGIATGLAAETSPNTLIKQADAALYLAKRQGKNKYELFDKRLNGEYKQRSFLVSQLKRGVMQNAFKVYYSPIERLADQSLMSVDGFLRFIDVNDNELLPDSFISLLIQTGEVFKVVEWMLDEVCKKIRVADSCSGISQMFSISLSLPLKILVSDELPRLIKQAVKRANVNPEKIALRISESDLSKSQNELIPALRNIKSSKVQLVLEDFGRENAALNLISMKLFNRLAVCRSLVTEVCKPNAKVILTAIAALAKENDIAVVAKTCDHSKQIKSLLEALGIEFFQDTQASTFQQFHQLLSDFKTA